MASSHTARPRSCYKVAVDPTLILKHLAKVERRIADGENEIGHQRHRVARLECEGGNSIEARRLLEQHEESFAALVATRNAIRMRLSNV